MIYKRRKIKAVTFLGRRYTRKDIDVNRKFGSCFL